MNNTGSWSDEDLHAFVDGQLPSARAAALREAMQVDAALAARVARQQALRTSLARAFDPVLEEPIPDRLLEAIAGRSTAATPIGAARRAQAPRPRPQPLWWAAAAASVVFAALIGWNLPRGGSGDFAQRDGMLLASGSLARALNRDLSAAPGGADDLAIPLSFRAEDGRYCRAFALPSGVDGVACRAAEGWRIEATGTRSAATVADEYRQAASSLSAAVLAAISRQQAGDALTIEEERRARDSDWH